MAKGSPESARVDWGAFHRVALHQRAGGFTERATWADFCPMATSSSLVVATTRSRSGASASSWARSNAYCASTPASPRDCRRAAGRPWRQAACRLFGCWRAPRSRPSPPSCGNYFVSGSPTTWCQPPFVFVDKLPLTANGKIDQKALPAPVLDRERAGSVARRSETEKTVAEAWSAVLSVQDIGVNDDFFTLAATHCWPRVSFRGCVVFLALIFPCASSSRTPRSRQSPSTLTQRNWRRLLHLCYNSNRL